MGYENNDNKLVTAYSQKVRAGKKRTYFFDIKEARNNTYSLIITESRKRFDDRGFDRSSIYVYQEDINKFAKGLAEAVDYIKTQLLPNYDFDEFSNDYEDNNEVANPLPVVQEVKEATVAAAEEEVKETQIIEEKLDDSIQIHHEEVDKW